MSTITTLMAPNNHIKDSPEQLLVIDSRYNNGKSTLSNYLNHKNETPTNDHQN